MLATMPPDRFGGIIDITTAREALAVLRDNHLPGSAPAGYEMTSSRYNTEVNQVAIVRRITGSEYEVTMTGTELALIRSALGEAERVSRVGIEVLDGADHSRHCTSAENCSLHKEIDALATREASLRSLRKTMAEVDRAAKPTRSQHATRNQLRIAARLPVPPPRWNPAA